MTTPLQERIGRQIAALRKRRGWSQRELAEAAECSPNTVARIETAKRGLSIDLLERIATALDVPVVRLFPEGEASEASSALLERVRDPEDLEFVRRLVERLSR